MTCCVSDADALNHFDGGYRAVLGDNATAGIFATFPQSYLTTLGGFTDQVHSILGHLVLNFSTSLFRPPDVSQNSQTKEQCCDDRPMSCQVS